MLWKPDKNHIMKWDSPWGTGYPGWHIECSVMARALLGADMIDIHTGGEDLKFPHHECEIAQTCGTTGASKFANFWIHASFLFVEGKKMSKSDGNFYTARDVFSGDVQVKDDSGKTVKLGKPVSPAVARFELIKSHYRNNMNFTVKGLRDSAATIQKLIDFRADLESKTGGQAAEVDLSHPVLNQFASALADDLNISDALSVMHPWVRGPHPDPHESLAVWQKMNSVLSIAPINEGTANAIQEVASEEEVATLEQAEGWLAEMLAAKADKDYPTSDALRAKIIEAGFEVQQTKEGASIKKKL